MRLGGWELALGLLWGGPRPTLTPGPQGGSHSAGTHWACLPLPICSVTLLRSISEPASAAPAVARTGSQGCGRRWRVRAFWQRGGRGFTGFHVAASPALFPLPLPGAGPLDCQCEDVRNLSKCRPTGRVDPGTLSCQAWAVAKTTFTATTSFQSRGGQEPEGLWALEMGRAPHPGPASASAVLGREWLLLVSVSGCLSYPSLSSATLV